MKRFISFFEIPAINFERAVIFYENLFEINMTSLECGHEKMAFFPDEEGQSPGAISWAKDFKPSPNGNGVFISLNCKDLELAHLMIEKNGGKIAVPKTKIEAESRGYFSVFIDCEGNRIGLYSDK